MKTTLGNKMCLSEDELHGIISKGPAGFASGCPVTGDFLAGPKTSPCACGLWQGLHCGSSGVPRFWESSSSGSQDLLLEAMLQVLSQSLALTTKAVGVHFCIFCQIGFTAVSRFCCLIHLVLAKVTPCCWNEDARSDKVWVWCRTGHRGGSVLHPMHCCCWGGQPPLPGPFPGWASHPLRKGLVTLEPLLILQKALLSW